MALKKLLISISALLLVGALAPASGASGRDLKPYRSKTVTIEVGKWVPYTGNETPLRIAISVTVAEFLLNCDIPTETQGFDAYLFRVPRSYRGVEAAIYTTGEGTSLTGGEHHDIDIYIYDDQCNLIAEYATSKRDELGLLPKEAAFIMLNNYHSFASGSATASFRLEPWRDNPMRPNLSENQ